jgi:2,4-dienoyl-CoA reductase-like NADH-dependent reductase (Old Yellow Enzyme family)
MQPVSASDIPSKAGGEIPRPLEKDEIMHIVKKYGEAAKRAQICGFDAVEIHAGHSYLISQFLSPITNKRTDEFGGSAENRARFAKLVIEEVRKQVGPFFPIFVRISADELMEGGNTLEDTLEYLKYFEKEGPTCLRTSSITSFANLARFSAEPPNSSVLLFVIGERNWLMR